MTIARGLTALFAFTAFATCTASTAQAGPEKNYIWRGWEMTAIDYMIVHALPKEPSDNDFYLICYGKRGEIELDIRGIRSGGYKLESETQVPTTFVFGKTRLPEIAVMRGPAEMNGGISITYSLAPDSPVIAAIARGQSFYVELAKAKTQIFSPKPAMHFFQAMAKHCRKPPPA